MIVVTDQGPITMMLLNKGHQKNKPRNNRSILKLWRNAINLLSSNTAPLFKRQEYIGTTKLKLRTRLVQLRSDFNLRDRSSSQKLHVTVHKLINKGIPKKFI